MTGDMTIAARLAPSRVPFNVLKARYRPQLALVRQMIGLVPDCDNYLEMWPTAFRTYNILLPNLLNIPAMFLGFATAKPLIGLAMYVSSRAAACPYCTAHTCSFALRRGLGDAAILGDRTPAEAAVARVAEGLGALPSSLSEDDVSALRVHFGEADAEWILLSIAMMGFLNKFMDACGVALEDASLADVHTLLKPTGWSPGKHVSQDRTLPAGRTPTPVDSLRTYATILANAPSAVMAERAWMRGMPGKWEQIQPLLKSLTGHDFPILGALRHRRAVRAIATVLRDNFDPATTVIGLRVKALCALVFAGVAKSAPLKQAALDMLAVHGPVTPAFLDRVHALGLDPLDVPAWTSLRDSLMATGEVSAMEAACLILARGAATSPAEIDPDLIDVALPLIAPEGVIELLCWVSVLQLVHRIAAYKTIAV